jgi:hypothetical protein
MDTICSPLSQIFSILCTGQNCPRYEATHRAQLLERRVQVAMANLAELGFEKVNIDKQIGQCVLVDLIHVASNERFLQIHPVSNNFEPKSSGNAHHQAICHPFDGHIICFVLVYVLHDQPIDVHRQPEHNLE